MENRKYVEYVLGDKFQAEGVGRWFDSVCGSDRDDIWDFQWFCSRLMHSGLSIVPAKNLVSNIGVGDDATHTQGSALINLPLYTIAVPVEINPIVVVDRNFDAENARIYGLTGKLGFRRRLLLRIKNLIKKHGLRP